MEDDDESRVLIEEDYYTFFNIPRNATNEEINNAYRRNSRLYHPDKHVEPIRKKEAEILFNKTKKAYEVLSDPHQRAIYDSLGTRGLETEGWEVVQRTKTPQEIREEYERLARERNERKLQQRTNPKGSVTVSVNATDLFSRYKDDFEYDESEHLHFPTIEVSGMSITQSIEAPLTLRDTMTMSGQLSTQNGTGSGSVDVSVRRLLSEKGWLELDIGAGNGPTFSVKGFRTLSKRTFSNMATTFQITPHGIRPGLITTLATQLDKHTVGYLTWRAGHQSSMSTTIVRDTMTSHAAFSIQFGIPHSFFSLSYTHKFEEMELKLRGSVKAGTFGAIMEYGAEKKVSQHSWLAASVAVGVPSGVTLKIKLSRANQTYMFPIHLSDELIPSPVFYATVTPVVIWAVVKKLIVDPIVLEQKQRDKEKQRELNKTRMAEKKKEASAAVELMRATFARVRSNEEAKRGLVIIKALYGRHMDVADLGRRGSGEEEGREAGTTADLEHLDEVIDVTIPLQCLVKDSKLTLHDASKSQLPGFYDPCMGEEKSLLVHYLFHSHVHETVIEDNEVLRIPKQSHRVNAT
ncbi:dnaJ homolog subfamily C member 11 isoform X2 [Zootermopsis nevadensis]|uniref:DnaJ-like protein subfamily C member 11 n=2 Tax=Zootermopsis nevadensis TaxID=136037 RepID=A0A067RFL1_ZOONE|nr:dnaJ homolog subfamily C member 11 isoform X1 [Zootermopsis nevadensis]XP_021920737.1 dnaJ homolog subfamily C member 11 isoform X2 [Zootermopsis nevadensis]KDR18967.1 DnaJ-like protein subfamily C member 11 [Zootermopsis nevadensis]